MVFKDAGLENTWRPENHSGKFYGPTRLREALYKSQNLVSIRILKQVTPRRAINYISPFGFPREKLNKDLSLALGASAITPMELATGYTALANGGFKVSPYFIERIEAGESTEALYTANPAVACLECKPEEEIDIEAADNELQLSADLLLQSLNSESEIDDPDAIDTEGADSINPEQPLYAERIMDERTHYLMNAMLQDVIKRGTGKRALALKRNDLAGKTGTTNDQKDAWFSGYNRDLVATVWVGFDTPKTLGRWAFGGNTALPIWVDFMAEALQNKEERPFPQPAGIVSVRIDPETGLLAAPGQSNAIFELFKSEEIPAPSQSDQADTNLDTDSEEEEAPPELLF